MTITPVIEKNIIEALGLTALPKEEQMEVLSTLGTAVFETALLQFLNTQGEWEQQSFESWIDTHADEPDMVEQLLTLYPTFGKILTDEILLLKDNFAGASV